MRRISKALTIVYIKPETISKKAIMSQGIENKEYSELGDQETRRSQILAKMLGRAAFDGWTDLALDGAGKDAGFTPEEVRFLFPAGVRDVLKFWDNGVNEAVAASMSAPEFSELKIREKVGQAVLRRFELLRPHKEAARRVAAFLALPINASLGASLSWAVADMIWRGLDDASTDFNYYSKRAILVGVYLSSFAKWLSDDSIDGRETKNFVSARIDNVMQIEKLKSQVRKSGIDFAAPIKALSKLRYGNR